MILVCLDNVRVSEDAKSSVDTKEGENQSCEEEENFCKIMNYISMDINDLNTYSFCPFCSVCISKYVFEGLC